MDEITELLARLADLNGEELAHLQDLCKAEYDRLKDESNTPEVVAAKRSVVEAIESVKARKGEIAEAQAAADTEAADLEARVNAAFEEDATDDDAKDETDSEDGGEDDGESETPAGANSESEAVAASAGRPSNRVERMANVRRGQARPSPEAAGVARRTALVAASGNTSLPVNTPIPDVGTLSEAMSDTLLSLGRGGRESAIVASARWTYPEDRQLLSGMDETVAYRRIMDTVATDALAASGGICAPVDIDWDLGVWAAQDRPIKDGLNQFQASRGGLTFTPPPDFSALSGASGIWTEATDVSPGGSVKNLLQIACATPTTVLVDAITTRLQFGNMQSRFAPEWIAANTDLALAAAARIGEVNLWTKIVAQSKLISAAQYLGTARDLLSTVDKLIASYKDVHRISDSQMMTAIFPRWARNNIRADITRELANGGNSGVDPMAVTDDQINAWFSMRGVKVIWALDGLPAQGTGAITYPTQNFVAETTETAEVLFPTKVVWSLYVEGTFQFLDGGRLDLGVVRDSTLDATNDYETFIETFEGVANRGVEALAVVSSVQPSGTSAGTTTPATSGL